MNKDIQRLFDIRNPWRKNKGFLAPKNYIIRDLEKDIETEINFWRTKSGAEIDFVVRRGQKLDLYEVKYAGAAGKRQPAAIASFGKKYDYRQAFVVTGAVDKKNNNFIPFWEV